MFRPNQQVVGNIKIYRDYNSGLTVVYLKQSDDNTRRMNSVSANQEHDSSKFSAFNTVTLSTVRLSLYFLVSSFSGHIPYTFVRLLYSETSVNEDNSFRNHIR
jgi:hypothetical protein